MKNLYLSILAISFLLLAVSCKTVKGTFDVAEKITLKTEVEVGGSDESCDEDDLFDFCDEPETVIKDFNYSPGIYSAKLKFSSKTSLVLTTKDADKKSTEIKFNIPKNMQLPTFEGEFSLTSMQIKQPYDIEGYVTTEFDSSGQTMGSESCTYTKRRRVCHRDDEGYRVCHRETVEVWGSREVEYHYEYTTKHVEFALLKPSSDNFVASFKGSHTSSDKVYDYKGTCY